MKLTTINWSPENSIGAIFTGNDTSNDRVLSINLPLGYQAMPNHLEMVVEL